MATTKPTTKAGQLLEERHGFRLYKLSTDEGYTLGGFALMLAAINPYGVALRVSRGVAYDSDEMQPTSQVVLTHDELETLIASYRAFQRTERKRQAEMLTPPWADNYDPFLDDPDPS